jgi:benzoyl-CoA reductase subunit BamC
MHDALILEERVQDVDEQEPLDEKEALEIGLESLADKYGLQQIREAVARISKKD